MFLLVRVPLYAEVLEEIRTDQRFTGDYEMETWVTLENGSKWAFRLDGSITRTGQSMSCTTDYFRTPTNLH